MTQRASSDYLTDLWSAEQLVAAHGADLRYTKSGGWVVWDGRRWQIDATGAAMRLTKHMVRSLYARAAGLESEKAREALVKHAIKSESTDALQAILRSATTEEGVECLDVSIFDANPWLLNCANGTLNLFRDPHNPQPPAVRPHNPADYLTHVLALAYDPDAPAPLWEAFLARVQPDPAMRTFLQRVVGYSLTGLADEQMVLFCYGTGKNGKSTFIETLQALLDPREYAIKIPMDVLLQRRNDSSPAWVLAELAGRRLVVGSEIEAGRRLNEALIKDLTGTDTIPACRKYKDPFTFRPEFTLWLYGNHKPILTGTDEGIQRRVKLIPFTQTIPPAERDIALPRKLLTELPGILAWAVRGCHLWQAEGLNPPEAVLAATAAYFAEMDVLAPFLADCCLIGRSYRVSFKDLYAAYLHWADSNGDHRPSTGPQFTKQLRERGFDLVAGHGNVRWWHGLGLRIDAVPPEDERVNGVNGSGPFPRKLPYERGSTIVSRNHVQSINPINPSSPKNIEKERETTTNGHTPAAPLSETILCDYCGQPTPCRCDALD